MERLRPWRKASEDDFSGNGILAPVLPACVAERLRSYPPLRVSSQSMPHIADARMQTDIGHEHSGSDTGTKRCPKLSNVAMPTLRRPDDRHTAPYRGRSHAMQLLRFLVKRHPTRISKGAPNAPQDSCALCAFIDVFRRPNGRWPVPAGAHPCSPRAQFCECLPRPTSPNYGRPVPNQLQTPIGARPPQTPAASF